MKFLSVADKKILQGGSQNVQINGPFVASTDYVFHSEVFKALNSLIFKSISLKKSILIGFKTIELEELEIIVLATTLEKEIEDRLTKLKQNSFSGFGMMYKYKNQEIKLSTGIRYPEENLLAKLIIMYNFCQKCIEAGKNIFFNITDSIPYWNNHQEINEEE